LYLLQGIHYQLPTFHRFQLQTIYLPLFTIYYERFQVLTGERLL